MTLFSAAFEDIKLLSYAGLLHRDCQLPLGATGHLPLPGTSALSVAIAETIEVVVCGAHLQDSR